MESLFELCFPIFCRKLTDTETCGMYWSRLFAVAERAEVWIAKGERERERDRQTDIMSYLYNLYCHRVRLGRAYEEG